MPIHRWDNQCLPCLQLFKFGTVAEACKEPGNGRQLRLRDDPVRLRDKIRGWRQAVSNGLRNGTYSSYNNGRPGQRYQDWCVTCGTHESEHVNGRCILQAGYFRSPPEWMWR